MKARQTGSGAIGFMVLLPVMLIVVMLTLEVGRVVLIRALLLEGVSDSARMVQLADEPVQLPELQQRWQQWADSMPLLQSVVLSSVERHVFSGTAQLLAGEDAEDDDYGVSLTWHFDLPLLTRQTLAFSFTRHVLWERRE